MPPGDWREPHADREGRNERSPRLDAHPPGKRAAGPVMTEASLRHSAELFCRQSAPRLASMLAAAAQGRPPDPADLAGLRLQAQALARELARDLGLEQDPQAAIQAQPEGLAVWERVLGLCLGLTALGLELTRAWGPAYLPPPEGDR